MTREEFIQHVETTQKAFRRFLVALCCGDSVVADDIAQESYIKAYLSCDGFRNPDKFKQWIFRIGYTTFLNQRRKVKNEYGAEDASVAIAKELADDRFRYQDLYTALERLSPTERTTILLYYMEGYSVKEISDLESVSAEAVRKQLSRGRIHLHHLLDK